MAKKRAMIYPFNIRAVSLTRYRHLLCDYDIVHVVAPKGLAIDDKDCSYIDEGPHIGLPVSNSFDLALEDCDTVIAVEYDFYNNKRFFNKVIECLKIAIEKGKNILCTMLLEESILNDLKSYAEYYHVEFIYMQFLSNNEQSLQAKDTIIRPINTPIIVVLGVGENCFKFELQLTIRDFFLGKNFNISQIGSRNYCELFGFHSFPDFMHGNKYDEKNKILAFNKYIRDIEATENPELIIIGIPGGIMQYNEKILNGFGVTAYEVGCAITSDYTVLAIPCDNINNNYIESLAKSVKYRNGMILDSICISNTKYNDESLNSQYRIPFLEIVPDKMVDLALSEYNLPIPVFKSYNQIQKTQLTETIYAQLTQNIDKTNLNIENNYRVGN